MVYWDSATDGVFYTVKLASTGDIVSATISGLSPGQVYGFLVVALNVHGQGNRSTPIFVLSAQEPGQMSQISISQQLSNVVFTWTLPS